MKIYGIQILVSSYYPFENPEEHVIKLKDFTQKEAKECICSMI